MSIELADNKRSEAEHFAQLHCVDPLGKIDSLTLIVWGDIHISPGALGDVEAIGGAAVSSLRPRHRSSVANLLLDITGKVIRGKHWYQDINIHRMLAHQKQMEVVAAIVEASDNPCLGVDTGDSLNFFRDKNDIDVFYDFLRDGDQKIKSVSSGRPVQIVHLPGDHAINKPGRKGLGYILDTDPVSAICAMQKQVVPIFQKINNVSSGGQVAILAIDDNLYHRNYLRYLDSINEEHKLKAEMVANNDFSLSIQEYLIRLAVDYKNNGGMLITCSHSHIPRKYFKDLIGPEDILVHGHMHWPNDNSILFRSIRYPHLTFKRGHPRVLTVGAPFFPLPNSGASFHREPVLVKVDINSKGTVEYEFR